MFATLRFWMHATTRFCMGNSRPYVVQWNQDELLIFQYKITKDRLAIFIQDQINELEKFVASHVLLGIPLESLGISSDIHNSMDTGDLETPGLGPFLPEATSNLDNQDSNKFLRGLAETDSERAPVKRVKNALIWDKPKSMTWLASIDTAWLLLYCLIHTLCGLAGRATEEALLNWTNELFGSSTNIRIRGDTVALDSAYHKGQLHTGTHKRIVRLLPYRPSRILRILLRVVRPVELIPILKFSIIAGPEYAAPVAQLYRTRIFVSWGKAWEPARMSSILKSWFHKGIGIPMGVRMYRHLATALQRRYIQYIKHLQPEDIQSAADAQAGRTVDVSERHYAVEKKVRDPGKKVLDFELVSAYWHEMLGVETYASKSKHNAELEIEVAMKAEGQKFW